jgi:hypothetical protein
MTRRLARKLLVAFIVFDGRANGLVSVQKTTVKESPPPNIQAVQLCLKNQYDSLTRETQLRYSNNNNNNSYDVEALDFVKRPTGTKRLRARRYPCLADLGKEARLLGKQGDNLWP